MPDQPAPPPYAGPLSAAEHALLEWIAATAQAGGGTAFVADEWAGEEVLVMADMPFRPRTLDLAALVHLAALGLVTLGYGPDYRGELTAAGSAWACG